MYFNSILYSCIFIVRDIQHISTENLQPSLSNTVETQTEDFEDETLKMNPDNMPPTILNSILDQSKIKEESSLNVHEEKVELDER